MDVELQILKHLARDAQPTVSVIDQYCQGYKDLFPEVRSYECFKYLHLGILSPIQRKSLPEITKIVGISSPQSLHHFLSNSPWLARELKERRLARTLKALKEEKIVVIIDETGDRKKRCDPAPVSGARERASRRVRKPTMLPDNTWGVWAK